MDANQESARAFFETHNKLRAIAKKIAPYENQYIFSEGALGSAGMEVDGVSDEYNEMAKERGDIVAEMKRLRLEAGDENILAELKQMQGSELAAEYIRKVPLKELKSETQSEARKETRKGIFGRFKFR